jgi:hypothetical protein
MKCHPAYRTTTLLVLALALIGLSVSCLQPHQRGDYLENAEEQQPKPGQGPQEIPEYHAE